VRPWLYGIAANLVLHHWRAERRMLRTYARTGVDPVLSNDDELVERMDARARRRELAAALAELRPRDREILLLHAWAELSDSEIAAGLSLPIGTVKSRLHRTCPPLLSDGARHRDFPPSGGRKPAPGLRFRVSRVRQ
jgi:RNA polymerase sigma factor (sigma-70 family)